MIRLDSTTRKLQIILGGAITTNQLSVTVGYQDNASAPPHGMTRIGGSQVSNTNSGTAVDICNAPTQAGICREIDWISVYNLDTVSAVVTLRYNDNGTTYNIVKVTLLTGEHLQYSGDDEFKCLDTSGNEKFAISALTGITQAASDNSTNLATTAFVKNMKFGAMPPSFQNGIYVPIVGANLATGDTDLYTVPAGKSAFISFQFRAYNTSLGNIDTYLEIKVSGTYYRISSTTTLLTVTGATLTIGLGIVLNAGESFSINTATNTGLNVRGEAFQFDVGDTSIATARILALANGNNTLFTAPANKTCHLLFSVQLANSSIANVAVANNSGGALNYYVNQVPSGGSVGTSNQLYPATSIADKTLSTFSVGSAMSAGDFINVNTSAGTAGQIAWVTYYQM